MTQDRSLRYAGRWLATRWRSGAVASASFALVVLGLAACATAGAPQEPKGSTTRAARQEAVRSIPLAKLSAPSRTRLNAVLNDPTVYRRLPVQATDCEPDLYLFLVRNPEVIVNIWEVMNISKCTLERTGPYTWAANDGLGTTGVVELVYRSPGLHVFYCDGQYEGPMFSRPIHGKCVCILKSVYGRQANGRLSVTTRLDSFVQLDSVGMEMIAKTLQPVVGKVADYNFTETARFLGSLSRTAELHGRGVERLAARLTRVQPERRSQFVELSAAVAEKHALSPDDVIEPSLPRLTARSSASPASNRK